MTEANIPDPPQPTMAELERAWEAWRWGMNWEVTPRRAHAELNQIIETWHAERHEHEKFRIWEDYLIVSAKGCTCSGDTGWGHEPMCGWEVLGIIQSDGTVK